MAHEKRSPHVSSTKKEDLKRIHEELRSIYADQDGTMPDLTRLDRQEGSKFTRFLVRLLLVFIVLSGASWAGFFVWNAGWFQRGDLLEVEVDGPTEAQAGAPVTYSFRYANHGNVPLASLGMTLRVPPSFEVTTRVPPVADERDVWTIGTLGPNSDGMVSVTGVFRSEVLPPDGTTPVPQAIQAVFDYKPANFSSDFQEIKTVSVRMTGSVLDATITGPEKAVSGDEVTYVVNVKNTGTAPAENVRASVFFPAGFNVASADPKPAQADQSLWTWAVLAPGELRAITVKGRYTSSATGEQTVRTDVAFLDGTVSLRQDQAETKTDVLQGTIALALVVNGTSRDQTVDLGRTLRASVSYTNTSPDAVGGLKLSLTATAVGGKPLPIDWSASDIGKNSNRTGGTITWMGTSEPLLLKIAPNATGTFDISLPIVGSLDPAKVADAFTLKLTGSYSKVGSVTSNRSVETSPIAVGVNTEFAADAAARFFDPAGAKVGTGPLPPKVGATTTYRIYWTLVNTLHDLTDLTYSAVLPADVSWKDVKTASVGTVSFEEATRTVTWSVPALPRANKNAVATFDLSITPKKTDAGSFFKLLNATAAEAMDGSTKERLSRGIDLLTTDLTDDPSARDKGVVEE